MQKSQGLSFYWRLTQASHSDPPGIQNICCYFKQLTTLGVLIHDRREICIKKWEKVTHRNAEDSSLNIDTFASVFINQLYQSFLCSCNTIFSQSKTYILNFSNDNEVQ